jgi:glycosyltransferase involved in cell wall biosynthesis
MMPGIHKVLLTGGHEVGGLSAFSIAMAEGFEALDYETEIVSPHRLFNLRKHLTDPSVLKILSTTAVFASPLGRQTICVTHGLPRPDAQGWIKTLAILASLELANLSPSCKLVAVSEYVAAHLRSIYDLRVDAVIRNPVRSIFVEPWKSPGDRPYLTYLGRLHPAKNVRRLLPPMRRLLDEDSSLRICIIGEGPEREDLEASIQGDRRIEFAGALNDQSVRQYLRQSRVLVSGCPTEALGLAYIEALSQGCAVAMPACGGGLEIAPELIGSQIQLLPLSFDSDGVLAVLRRAASAPPSSVMLSAYEPRIVAQAYLDLVSREKFDLREVIPDRSCGRWQPPASSDVLHSFKKEAP